MSDETPTPVGVIAVLTAKDGHVVATATDFDRGGYGGFSLVDAQGVRARHSLAFEAVREMCHPDIVAALDAYRCEQIIAGLRQSCGYRVTLIPVGHGEGVEL